MSQDWAGMQNGTPTGDLKQQITDLGPAFATYLREASDYAGGSGMCFKM